MSSGFASGTPDGAMAAHSPSCADGTAAIAPSFRCRPAVAAEARWRACPHWHATGTDCGTGRQRSSRPARPPAARLPDRGRGFDYWLIAPSWSPSLLVSRTRNDRERARPRGYGFVRHGLWLQHERGGGLQDCPTRAALTRGTIERTPASFALSWRLVQHEWRAHGACSGLAAPTISDFPTALAAVRIPPEFTTPNDLRRMQADDVRDAFIAANLDLRADRFAVVCQPWPRPRRGAHLRRRRTGAAPRSRRAHTPLAQRRPAHSRLALTGPPTAATES
ncbi:MAG: hypothetical protein KIS84_05465 [Dokdonella sp.]|nr:hypothetical protein [Dokdonella sp.]